MVRIGVLLLAATLLSSITGCTRMEMQWVPTACLRASPASIASDRQAILAARGIWRCIHPDYPGNTVAYWLSAYVAVRQEDGTWHVLTKLPPGYVGPTTHFVLAPRDGELLRLYMLQ